MWHMGAPTCPPPLQRCRSPCVWVQQMLAAVSWRFWTSAVITSGKESSEACTTKSSHSQHRHTSQSYSFLRLVNIFPASRLTDNCPSDPFSQMDLSHPWVRGCDFIEKKSNWHSGSQEKWKRETHHFCRKHQPGHVSPHLPLPFSIGKDNFHPALVILSLSGQIGSTQWAPLLFAVTFEMDKSGYTHQWKNPNQGGIEEEKGTLHRAAAHDYISRFLASCKNKSRSCTEAGQLTGLRGELCSSMHRNDKQPHRVAAQNPGLPSYPKTHPQLN